MEETSAVNEKLKKAVILALDSGYQIDQEAFDFLQTLVKSRNTEKLMKLAIEKANRLPERPMLITFSLLKEVSEEGRAEEQKAPVARVGKTAFHPYAKEIQSEIEVLEDPTNELNSKGAVEDFLSYFRDRFTRIKKILKQRLDARDAVPIRTALEASPNSEVRIIGMITEKKERKNQIIMQIEDEEDKATVIVTRSANGALIEKAQKILLDQVLCVNVIKGRGNFFIATDFICPDVPNKKQKRMQTPVYAALLSDLHIGSKKFLGDIFNQFILWLNGKIGTRNDLMIASHIKYVIIAGDLVDGIGVYPNQENELAICNIYDQYKLAAQYLEKIPDYIDVIIIPGNHDATRQALPQPAIPRKYAEPVYEARKVIMLGEPARIKIHERETLLFHGRSLDDIIGSIPGVTYQNLQNTIQSAMELLLKSRHLAPIYGKRTAIAPEPRDYLVIEEPPDIFHAGHVHVFGYEHYRNTLILNSGTWQAQTDFQRKMGLNPTPGIAPIVDLRDLSVTKISFI